MNRRQVSFLLSGALVLSAFAGCHCCSNNERVRYVPPPPGIGACDRCAANGPLPPRFAPNGAPLPAGPAPVGVAVPPAGTFPPPYGGVAPPPVSAPAPTGVSIQQYGSSPTNPPSSSSSAVVPGVYLQQPEPVAPVTPSPRDVAIPSEPRPSAPQSPEPPPARDDRTASPSMPVDIPQFAAVKTNIASGLQPFSGGIAWLQSHGYRTVLHVRLPGEVDSAARKQIEQSGLRFLSLEVSPQTLSRDLVDQFNRLIGDANNQPLFVYDRDGSLAGALWYLHFRLVDGATEEKAREEATRLGFKQDGSDAHIKMWLAVQTLLNDIKK